MGTIPRRAVSGNSDLPFAEPWPVNCEVWFSGIYGQKQVTLKGKAKEWYVRLFLKLEAEQIATTPRKAA